MSSWLRVNPDDEDDVAAAVDRLESELAEWAAARGREVDAELVAHLVQMRARYGGDGELDVWDDDALTALLLGIAPAKTVFDDADHDAALPGLAALVDLLADRGLLAPGSDAPAELHRRLTELAEPFAEAIADPSRRSPATALAYAMRDDGVDLTDEQAVGEWLTAFNAGTQEQRNAVLGPPPGPSGDSDAAMPSTLPGVEVDEATLGERVAATPMLRRLRAFVDHLGDHGCELAENRDLARADAEALTELLGTGGESDPLAAGGPSRGSSSAEFAEVDAVFRLALAAGFARRHRGRVMAVKTHRPMLAERPLEAWHAAAAALLDQGVVSEGTPDPLPYAEWFDDAAPELLLGLWAAGQPVELPLLAEGTADDVRRFHGLHRAGGGSVTRFEGELARHVALLAERLAFAGLAELAVVDGPPAADGPVTVESFAETTIAITPLAKRLLEPTAEMHGFTVAPVGELVDLDAADLLAELGGWAGDTAEAELDAWVAARGDAVAGAELCAVLPGADPLARQSGLAALWSLGAAAEPSIRALTEHAELRPHALAWLIGRGLASPEELSADEAAVGMVDALAAVLIGGASGDDVAEVLLAGLGDDRDEALARIGELWRVDSPHTPAVLEALGDAGDAAVAKAARKALFKHRSQG